VEYEIVRNGTNQSVFSYSEEVTAIPGASAQQVTIEKLLSLSTFEPGQYTLKLKVTDRNRNQVLNQSATFTIT
jgi:hypothetical protein